MVALQGSFDAMRTVSWSALSGAVALVLLAGPGAADDPADGIVAWWRAEGDGLDSVGSSHGTVYGGTSFSEGAVGRCVLFDGSSGYVELSNSGSLDVGTNDFTLCAWVFCASGGAGFTADQDIFQKSVGSYPNDRGYLLEVVGGGPQPVLRLRTSDTDANKNDLMVNAPLVLDRWFHIAGVRTGDTNRIYVDGELAGEQTSGSKADLGTGGEAQIGAKVHAGLGRFFHGGLDEVSLYGRALAQGEIRRLGTLRPRVGVRTAPGLVEVSWSAQSNRTYDVTTSPDLSEGSWSVLGSSVVATGSPSVVVDAPPGPGTQRFYRVSTPLP
jgi:hypothetical protein